MNGQTMALVPTKPDSEVAKALKAEIQAKLEELCPILDRAVAAGFVVSYGTGPRWDGKQHVTQLLLAKHF